VAMDSRASTEAFKLCHGVRALPRRDRGVLISARRARRLVA
jgi:hypothetical protein